MRERVYDGNMREAYVTVMFPYPSGDGLHVGHWYNYSVTDSYCRYLRYRGQRVFQPFGYDSFGLPAENYARKVGGDPREITYANMDKFRDQMVHMDTEFVEQFATSDPEYVRQTKELFMKMYDAGLAYKKDGEVDYCTSCETVLAREQVKDGRCDRCSSVVEKRMLNQWYFRITDYTQRLIDGLDGLDYPEKTKNAQRKWLENQHDWCVSRQRAWGCPIPIEGETDTLDTFVDSSFYTIAYCWRNGMKAKPVDLYVGGNEHACMHLIYARFVCMFLYDQGVVDFEEPFLRVVHQGMILNEGEKMSKSKGNAVSLDGYDSDEVRFYLMFIGHYFDGGSWSDKNISGIRRFIGRMREWMSRTGEDVVEMSGFKERVYSYTESFKFNKVVSEFMIFQKANSHLDLTPESKEEVLSLLEVYMPSIRSKMRAD